MLGLSPVVRMAHEAITAMFLENEIPGDSLLFS